jgi:phage I-like protein
MNENSELSSGRVLIVPIGELKPRDGRTSLDITDESAVTIIKNTKARAGGVPLMIDYEHQSLHTHENGQPAPAAGRFTELELEPGVGIFAIGVEWTERAKEYISTGEYGHISPVLGLDKSGKKVVEILGAALTNTPALNMPLVKLSVYYGKGKNMEKVAEALGLQPDATEDDILQAVLSLIKERETSVNSISLEAFDAVKSELAALKSEVAKEKIISLVNNGLKSGKIVPAQKEWAENLGMFNLKMLQDYIEKAQPVVPLSMQSDTAKQPDENAAAKSHIWKVLGLKETDNA